MKQDRDKKRAKQDELVAKLLKQGVPWMEVAQRVGMSPPTTSKNRSRSLSLIRRRKLKDDV
jgi:hypothetical protein